MTVIDDITDLLTPVLHTNTTKDITAAAVRAALITAFGDIVTDTDTKTAAATTAATGAKAAAGALALAAQPHSKNLLDARIGQVARGPIGTGIIASPNALIDQTLNQFTGAVEAATGWMVPDYAVVKPGGSITVGSGGNGIHFYDINRAYLSSVSGPFTEGQVVSVPANAYFVRSPINTFYANGNTVAKWQIMDGSGASMPFIWQQTPAYVNQVRPWAGKVWSFHGDAWGDPSAGNDWTVRVAQYHGVKHFKNQAVSGRNVIGLLFDAATNAALTSTYFSDVDSVIVLCGMKDATNPTISIGAITDATSANTFYGWYKKFIEQVLTWNPYLRFVLVTPHRVFGFADSVILPYRTAVKEIADLYALKVFDLWAESQWTSFTYTAYADDSTKIHPGYRHGGDALQPKDVGSLLVYGAPLKAFMHTVFPHDYIGDPILYDGNDTYLQISVT
jgi:hypothetical protein